LNYGRNMDPNLPKFRHMRDVDYVSGAALMVRRTFWDEVGGLNQEYALAYYEDVDLCFKAPAAGHRVVVQPASIVVHHEGISAGRDVTGTGMRRYQRLNMERFRTRWQAILAKHALAGTETPSVEAEQGA
jgi:GT2 family glycosyltransferase